MEKLSRIYVAGNKGMVGTAIVRQLIYEGYNNLLYTNFDLRCQSEVERWFGYHKPEYVFLVAAKVGGIEANNNKKAEFLYDNLAIQNNVIHSSYTSGVKKLLFTGSSCIYPKACPQPIKEEYLLTSELEPTNEPYAIAKIAGVKMCQAYRDQYGCNFIAAMPTNSYGDNDNYNPDSSHVIPALIHKISVAKTFGYDSINLLGTGLAKREFIYVDDMADALIFLMNNYNERDIINVGTGDDVSIWALAEMIAKIFDWNGTLNFTGEMDGTMKKRLDVSKINALGWAAQTKLIDGLKKTIHHFISFNNT